MEDVFEKRLKQLREKKAVSQKEVAESIGVKAQTISGYESGRTKPPLDIAAKLAKYFGASLDWLCGIEDSSTLTNRKLMKTINVLASAAEGTVSYRTNDIRICILSRQLVKYLSERARMKSLLKEGVIDKELFQLWEEKNNRDSWLDEPFSADPYLEDSDGIPIVD